MELKFHQEPSVQEPSFYFYMRRSARFGIIFAILKMRKTPIEECLF